MARFPNGIGFILFAVSSFGASLFPLAILVCAWPTRGASLVMILVYVLQVFRVTRRSLSAGMRWPDSWLYSVVCVLNCFPCAIGVLSYWCNRLLRRRRALIEYKSSS